MAAGGQERASWRPLVVRPADTRIGPAVRSALAMGLPLLALVLTGHPQGATYAAFGAFTGLYAGGLPFRRRARALAGVGAGFVAAVVAGSGCAVASSSLGATGWVLAVAIVAAIAKWGLDATRLRGPGAWMFLFAFAASTQSAAAPSDVALRALLATGGAVTAWVVVMSAALRDTSAPERWATAAAVETTVRVLGPGGRADPHGWHLAHAALHRAEVHASSARPPTRERLLALVRQAESLLTDATLSPDRPPRPEALAQLAAQASALRTAREPWSRGRPAAVGTEERPPRPDTPPAVRLLRDQQARHAATLRLLTASRALIGAAAAGSLSVALHLGHPYWAPVSAAAVLQSTHVRMTWERSVQRGLGTAGGLLLGAVLLEARPAPWAIATLVVLLQLGIELLIGRNYALGVVFVTPLTMLMSDLLSPGLAQTVLVDRLTGVALGIVVGLAAALLVVHPRAAASLRHALERCRAATSWAETAGGPGSSAAAEELRDALLELRTADETARGETWPSGVSHADVADTEQRARRALAGVRHADRPGPG